MTSMGATQGPRASRGGHGLGSQAEPTPRALGLDTSPGTVFDSVRYLSVYADRCDRLISVEAHHGQARLEWTGGLCARTRRLLFPFYAPYSLPRIGGRAKEGLVRRAARRLVDTALELGCASVEVALPPLVSSPELIGLTFHALVGAGFEVGPPDLAHNVLLGSHNPTGGFSATARQKLRVGLTQGYAFSRCETEETKRRALATISINRRQRSHGTFLMLEELQVLERAADVMVFELVLGVRSVAAAVCIRTSPEVYHVAGWGHDTTSPGKHPMNVLAFEVFRSLAGLGARRVDLGISGRGGEVSEGLCEFKRSIGGEASVLLRLRLTLPVPGAGSAPAELRGEDYP